MTEPLRLGFIGCGMISSAHAAAVRLLAEDGLVRLVAAADPDPEGIDRVASIAGGVDRRSADGHDVIADPDVDAVVLITPTRFHREYVLAVAEAGKPLFTEKPLAPTFPVVRELHAAVAASGIPAQVGFQSRFHPIINRLREIVVSGELGAPMGYTLRDDQYWPTGDVVPGHTSWRSDLAEAGGGALLEHSIHSCDVLSWLFGPAARVYATKRHVFGYTVEDTAALTIEHAGGVIGNLVTVFNGVQGREERRLEVFFERVRSSSRPTSSSVRPRTRSDPAARESPPSASTWRRCVASTSLRRASTPTAPCGCTSTSPTARSRPRCATALHRHPASTTR